MYIAQQTIVAWQKRESFGTLEHTHTHIYQHAHTQTNANAYDPCLCVYLN
jgi:hypothetical protein